MEKTIGMPMMIRRVPKFKPIFPKKLEGRQYYRPTGSAAALLVMTKKKIFTHLGNYEVQN